ncbi:hypothetical protein PIROE2DRAFT_65396 [Piromyces sp. E2]|nr:hypothetical protein PIROE2DRAFT_65396 [Piromyces sp. E2]|eukprot:OUM56726.1 hypothetical protein PIROE2DRAFT_65396 [Piromyces sp. E2]
MAYVSLLKYKEKKTIENLRETSTNDEYKMSVGNLRKRDVYKSVERITSEKYINKRIRIFNNFYECEIACRFLRKNRSIEAFQLMKKLIEEGNMSYQLDELKNEAVTTHIQGLKEIKALYGKLKNNSNPKHDTIQVYILFLTDVMNNKIGRRNTRTSVDVKTIDINKSTENLKSSLKNKTDDLSSTNSIPHSESTTGVGSMGRYISKKMGFK